MAPRPLTLDDGEAAFPALEGMLAADPGNRDILNAKALMLLSSGRLAEGWAEYHWRIGPDAKVSYDHFPVPRWDGASVAGKHVLVWLEHGVGDQIFGASMLSDLRAIAGSVTVFCNRRLSTVFRWSMPGITFYRVGEPVPRRIARWDFDCQLSVGDLGQMFRNTLDFTGSRYLLADPVQCFRNRAKYRRDGKKLVGLSWWSKNHIDGLPKCAALLDLWPILKTPDAQFVNLQYGDNRSEIEAAKELFGLDIIDDRTVNQLVDLEAFAAQVNAMDFVITTSNTTAHMAGALGVPGIVLLPRGRGRFWYWHQDRSDSPWYPSLTLVRQDVEGEWDPAIQRAALLLQEAIKCPVQKLTA